MDGMFTSLLINFISSSFLQHMQCTVNDSNGINPTEALKLFVTNNIKFEAFNVQRTTLQEFENLKIYKDLYGKPN